MNGEATEFHCMHVTSSDTVFILLAISSKLPGCPVDCCPYWYRWVPPGSLSICVWFWSTWKMTKYATWWRILDAQQTPIDVNTFWNTKGITFCKQTIVEPFFGHNPVLMIRKPLTKKWPNSGIYKKGFRAFQSENWPMWMQCTLLHQKIAWEPRIQRPTVCLFQNVSKDQAFTWHRE